MNFLPVVRAEFDTVMLEFEASAAFRFLTSGRLRRQHYVAMLRETYHHLRPAARLHGIAMSAFRAEQRDALRELVSLCACEARQLERLVEDLECLGVHGYVVAAGTPLPTTRALLASAHYQVAQDEPVGYLGYLFFMRFMPLRIRPRVLAALSRSEMRGALQFFTSVGEWHEESDGELARCLGELMPRPRDLSLVVGNMRSSAVLYATMLRAAIEEAEGKADSASIAPLSDAPEASLA